MSERTQKPLSQPHQSSCITMKLTRLLERLRNEQNPAHDKLSNDPTQEKGKEKEKEKEQGKEDQGPSKKRKRDEVDELEERKAKLMAQLDPSSPSSSFPPSSSFSSSTSSSFHSFASMSPSSAASFAIPSFTSLTAMSPQAPISAASIVTQELASPPLNRKTTNKEKEKEEEKEKKKAKREEKEKEKERKRKEQAFPPPSVASSPFQPLAYCRSEFMGRESFLKGLKWSPDGLCLLANSNDRALRLFELPPNTLQPAEATEVHSQWGQALKVKEGEDIYDFDWFPLMNSSNPSSCVFIASSKEHPLHLWDAFTGQRRAMYVAVDHVYEPVSAISVAFSSDGSKLYAGYNKEVRVFDVSNPGALPTIVSTVPKRKSQMSFYSSFPEEFALNGLVSSIAVSTNEGPIAFGSFNSKIALLDPKSLQPTALLSSHRNGITHLKWSSDGQLLFAGSRKEDTLHGFDLRNTSKPFCTVIRKCSTNQRMSFDLDRSGRFLYTGDQNGSVLVYDISEGGKLISQTQVHNDVVNSVQLHPSLAMMACGTGQRKFLLSTSDDEEDSGGSDPMDDDQDQGYENMVSLFRIK